jgi:protein-tyrosine phosphatase
MINSVNNNIIHTEDNHLKGQRFTDIHCHCLPGLDDGPANMTEALVLCKALVADGITNVIATPHQLGRFDGCYNADKIREAVARLNKTLKKKSIPLTVLPGADVRVDERIPQLLESDSILTLSDGGKYILLELPYEIFVDIEPLLKELISLEVMPIISHPERHIALCRQPKVILKWLNIGAQLQITASSFLGDFGSEAQRATWHFLCSGWAILVATDAHDTNVRRPQMRAAFECISKILSEDIARLVCIENPSRVVNGRDILPVPVHKLVETNR